MSEEFEKTRRDFKKKNKYAASLRDQGDWKGAFSLKVVDSRKQEYKRKKIRKDEIYEADEDY